MSKRVRLLDEILQLVYYKLNENSENISAVLDDRYIYSNGVFRFKDFGSSIGMFRGIVLDSGWKVTLQLVDKMGKAISSASETDVRSPDARFILGVLHPEFKKKLSEVDPTDYDNAGLNGVIDGRSKVLTGEQVNMYMQDLEKISSYEEIVEKAKEDQEEERVEKEKQDRKEKAGIKDVEKRGVGRPKTKLDTQPTEKRAPGRPFKYTEAEREFKKIEKEVEKIAQIKAGIRKGPGRPKHSEEVKAQKEQERKLKKAQNIIDQGGAKELATLYNAPEENVELDPATEEDLRMRTAVETEEGLAPILLTKQEFNKLQAGYTLVRYPDRETGQYIKPANDPKRPLDGFKGPPTNFEIASVMRDGAGNTLSVVSTKHATKTLGRTERQLIFFTLADLQLYGYGLSSQTAKAFGRELRKKEQEDPDTVVQTSDNTIESIVDQFKKSLAFGKKGSINLKQLEIVVKKFERYLRSLQRAFPEYDQNASPFHIARRPEINKGIIMGILQGLKSYDFTDPRHTDRAASAVNAYNYVSNVLNKYVPDLLK